MIQKSILKRHSKFILFLAALFAGIKYYSQHPNYPKPRIDHVLIAVNNLDSAKAEYEKHGFTVIYAGSAQKALNALIFLKDGTAIELIGKDRLPFLHTFLNNIKITRLFGIMKDRIAAFKNIPPGFFNYALYSAKLDSTYRYLKQHRLKAAKPVSFSRLRDDMKKIEWKLVGTFPYDLPFFIENYSPSRLSDTTYTDHRNKVVAIDSIVIETNSFNSYNHMYNVIYDQIPKIVLRENLRTSTYTVADKYVVLKEVVAVQSIFTKKDRSMPVRLSLKCENGSEIIFKQVNSFITLTN